MGCVEFTEQQENVSPRKAGRQQPWFASVRLVFGQVIKGDPHLYSMASNTADGGPMSIDLKLCQSFVALCEEKNFARAAERLKISPPTLTHQIQKLERLLGVQLLTRKTKKSVQLTEAGARFCVSARDVLNVAAEAELNARAASRGENGCIQVGYLVNASVSGLMQSLLADFYSHKPGINLELRTMVSADIINGIAEHRIDVGLVAQPTRYPPGLEGFVISEQPCVLAVHRHHRLAKGKQPVEPSFLSDEPFVVANVESEVGFKRLTDTVAELGRFVPKVSRRAPEMNSILTYVAAGFGIAVVPRSLTVVQMPNLVFREFVGAATRRFPLVFVYRSNDPSPTTRAFVEFMTRYRLGANCAQERAR
jgi:DNA-binding transcriptional LysR family regulator